MAILLLDCPFSIPIKNMGLCCGIKLPTTGRAAQNLLWAALPALTW
jgi:hypothetical protein